MLTNTVVTQGAHTVKFTRMYLNKVFESEGVDTELNRRSQSMDGELMQQEAGRRAGDDAFVAPASNSYR